VTPEQAAAEIMNIKNNGKRRRLMKRLAKTAKMVRLEEEIRARRARVWPGSNPGSLAKSGPTDGSIP
jgi:hypothetical protein